ncbi:MAG TPA: pantoate--beta-alanine ligase [Acidobacteriaceae bacterium]|nr:pantoate--beta-alanine ligase [Acidobacteriaceae bacterium]
MFAACRALRILAQEHSASPVTFGLVPTMGALHDGHLSLVAAAREQCNLVAASIFINPTQFGPNEDLASYPRDFDSDCAKLEAAGVHVLFAPDTATMYPAGNTTTVDPGPIGERLDGASRPGHFRGVATIVTRLFAIAAPDKAYFGQKDAAQVAVLRNITRDLNLPVELAVCPIVREPDGLAMSSRNRYLSAAERSRALVLSRSLTAAKDLARSGETRAEALTAAMLAAFDQDDPDPGARSVSVRVDYAAVVDPETLLPVGDTSNGALLAVAAVVGTTRLIDNLLLPPR